MRINESVALVSGANRDIGRAFVEALLRHSSPAARALCVCRHSLVEAVQGTVLGPGTLREMIVRDDGPDSSPSWSSADAGHIHGMFASAAYRAAIPDRLRAFRDIKTFISDSI
jgi:NAD(P)-dependent dehydrogenase (short-subunit alcohol dehydrogenase family)